MLNSFIGPKNTAFQGGIRKSVLSDYIEALTQIQEELKKLQSEDFKKFQFLEEFKKLQSGGLNNKVGSGQISHSMTVHNRIQVVHHLTHDYPTCRTS